ncbi:LysR family transcriptional regulator [Clostridium transplantifaecale]|uniref:LysR family transcriptional regulator n=1 Tax=Clostridium transplantifaecale TaxID=2479838 RepID=UPI000F6421C5|nr:LysR family transcriptional regulator [Clostridium transplantifaecale]
MEIRQLRYFVQVCESGSLLRASEILFISHQALSKSLSLLEKELGAALFYRTPKGMIPTQFGQELLLSSRPLLEEWERLNQKLEESANHYKGKIRLGLSGGLIYFGSSKIWEYFKELHPHTEIESFEHGYIEGLRLLKAGTLDAVIISDYENSDGYVTYSLPSTRRLVIVEKNNPLTSKEELEFKDLKNQKFILCINDFAYNKFLRLCQAEGFTPNVRRTSDTVYMYKLCSEDGLCGLCIDSNASNLVPKYPELRTIPFKDNAFPYPLTLVVRNNYPKPTLIKELVDFLTYSLNSVLY